MSLYSTRVGSDVGTVQIINLCRTTTKIRNHLPMTSKPFGGIPSNAQERVLKMQARSSGTTRAATLAPLNQDDELTLSQLVHDITLEEGLSSEDEHHSFVSIASRHRRTDPRLQQPAPVSVGRRRARPTKCMPTPIVPRTPTLLRTLALWCPVTCLLPLLNAAGPGRALLASICLIRFVYALRVLFIVLGRCLTKRKRPPVGPVLTWELWAPIPQRRAVVAVLCVLFIIPPFDIVVRLLLDFLRA